MTQQRQFKLGLIIEGDAKGGIRAVKSTEDELTKLQRQHDKTGRANERHRRQQQRMDRQMQRMIASTGRMVLGLAGVASAGAAIGKASRDMLSFERTLSRIEGLVGVAREEVDAMGEDILAMAPQVEKSTGELAEALFFVTSAGFRGAEAMDILRASAQASSAGLGDVAAIADTVTSAVNAYGPEVLSAAQSTDVLVAAVREGKLEASEMGPALSNVVGTASALNVSFQDVAGTMAVFSRTGTNAARGATAVNAVFNALLRTSREGQQALDDVNLSLEQLRRIAAEDGVIAVMRTLDDAFDGNLERLRLVISETEAFRGVMNALSQDSETVDGVLRGVADATGALDSAFDAAARTTDFELNAAKIRLNRSLQSLADTTLPAVVSGLADVVEQMDALAERRGAVELINRMTAMASGVGTIPLAEAFDGLIDRALGAGDVQGEIGVAVAPIQQFLDHIATGESDLRNYVERLSEGADVIIPFARGMHDAATGADAMADAADRGSEGVAKQIAQQRELLSLLESGMSLSEAETTARLRGQGASAAQVEEFLRLQSATDALVDSREAAAESSDKMSRSEERLHGQIAQTRREIELMNLGFSAEQATRQAELELASDLERQYLLLRNEARAMREEQEATNRTMLEFQQELDRLSFGNAFAQGFDDASRAAGDLLDGLNGLINAQSTFDQLREESAGNAAELAAIHSAEQRAQVGLFGDMTQAAKGFFDEGSKGYAALTAAEQTFRAIELAMAAQAMAEKLGLIQAETAAVVTAAGIKGTAEGTAAVASSAVGVPWPGNLVAIASTIAALAAVGVSLAGSGGGSGGASAAPAGSGRVLGDPMAMSESILNASEITADATQSIVGINTQMLRSMQSLERGIQGVGSMVARGGFAPDVGLSQPDRNRQMTQATALFGVGGETAALAMLEREVGALVGSALRGIGLDAFGNLIEGFSGLAARGINAVGDALFGGGQSIRDQGVDIDAGTMAELLEGALIRGFAVIRTSGGVFSGSSRETVFGDLDEALAGQFQGIIDSVGDAAIAAADALGISADEIDRRLDRIDIEGIRLDFAGATGDQITERINNAFSAVFDDVAAGLVPFIDELQRLGEGAGETLVRVASNVQVAGAGLERIGTQIDARSPERIAAISTALIDAAGDFSEFAGLTQGFVDDFRSEQEQLAIRTREATNALDQLGFELPATRDGFAALVDSLQVTDEASARTMAELLALAPVMDEVFSGREDALRQAFRAESRDLDRIIQQYADASRALTDFSADLTRMIVGADAGAAGAGRIRSEFEALAARARTGDISAIESLPDVGRAFADQLQNTAGNRLDLQRGLAAIQREILAAEDIASQQGSIAEQQLNEMERQVSALIDIDDSVRSVEDVLRSIGQLPAGEGFAMGGIATGPTSGYTTTLHGTEAVVPLPDGRSIPAVVTNGDSDRRLAALERQMERLNRTAESGFRAVATHTAKTAKQTERSADLAELWDADGLPQERTA